MVELRISERYHATCITLLTDLRRIIQIKSISRQTSTYDGRGVVTVHFFKNYNTQGVTSKFVYKPSIFDEKQLHLRYSSLLSWHSRALNTRVFFNFCRVARTWNACDTRWATRVQYFVHCTRAIFVRCTRVTIVVCCTRVIVELLPWFTGYSYRTRATQQEHM